MSLIELKQSIYKFVDKMKQDRWGLFCDIDGTISDIAPTPATAKVRPLIRKSLEAIRPHLAVTAIVTGRQISQAIEMVKLENVTYFGTYGLEKCYQGVLTIAEEAYQYTERLINVSNAISMNLSTPEVIIQKKPLGLSLHYRQAKDPINTRKQILTVIKSTGASDWMKIFEGRMVVELGLPVEINKGTCIDWLVNEESLTGLIVIGDDISDISMFEASSNFHTTLGTHTFNIGVIEKETSNEVIDNVSYQLEGVDDVESFLTWLSKKLNSNTEMNL